MIQRSRVSNPRERSIRPTAGWNVMHPFQFAMYRWSTLHPYNVAFVAEMDKLPEHSRLEEATRAILGELGVGGVEMDPRKGAYRFGAYEAAIVDVKASENARQSLDAWISDELNRPFPRNESAPLSFPLRVRTWKHESCQAVAFCFDHWIGDGSALTDLMARILRRSMGLGSPPGAILDFRELPIPRQAMADWLGWKNRCRRLIDSIRRLRALRTSYCPSHGDRISLAAATRVASVPDRLPDVLLSFARAHASTINDVLLAGVLEACDSVLASRFQENRRRDLAVACITSLRSLSDGRLDGKGGLYLGYFHAFAQGRLPSDFAEIVHLVRDQSREMKRRRTDLCSQLELSYCNWTWRWLSPKERIRQMLNNNPVAAGLSNMRTSLSFTSDMFPPIRRIFTAVSPGVTTPLAVHATTTQGRMAVTFNYRTSAYREDQIDQIVELFQTRMERIAELRR